ncbi:low molecular weight phosphotyrosine protein phosphatase, partial [Acinetobacter baumannii]|nr:low molecular weight phosphotyrosine protein phosphatase [Acinetobacter baumannii]
MQIKNILVVCIGNICRSPMAEYFLKQQYPQLNIESAGIS